VLKCDAQTIILEAVKIGCETKTEALDAFALKSKPGWSNIETAIA
jgi:hypothetical protein